MVNKKQERETLSDLILRRKRETGWSFGDIARRSRKVGRGVSSGYLSKLANLEYDNISLDTVASLAFGLDVSHDTILRAAGLDVNKDAKAFDLGFNARVLLSEEGLTDADRKAIVEELAIAYEVIRIRRQRAVGQ